MKHYYRIFLLLLLSCSPILGWSQSLLQVNKNTLEVESADSAKYQIPEWDFAVPDIPAFKALGTEPVDVLRPSTTRKLSVMIDDLLINGEVIPESFAAEFNPYLIIYDSAYLSIPSKAPLFVRTFRLSVGTDRTMGSLTSKAAVGVRVTILDKGDVQKTDKAIFEQTLKEEIDLILNGEDSKTASLIKTSADQNQAQYLKDIGLDDLSPRLISPALKNELEHFANAVANFPELNPADYIFTDDKLFKSSDQSSLFLSQKKKEEFVQKFETLLQRRYSDEQIHERFNEKLTRTKRRVENLTWSRNKIDLGAAITGIAKDTLIRSLHAQSYNGWGSWALSTGKRSQFLTGVHYNLSQDSLDNKFRSHGTISAREFFGSNTLKWYIDSQLRIEEGNTLSPTNYNLSAATGLEWAILGKLWLNFYVGYQDDLTSKKDQLIGNIDLRYALPGNLFDISPKIR